MPQWPEDPRRCDSYRYGMPRPGLENNPPIYPAALAAPGPVVRGNVQAGFPTGVPPQHQPMPGTVGNVALPLDPPDPPITAGLRGGIGPLPPTLLHGHPTYQSNYGGIGPLPPIHMVPPPAPMPPGGSGAHPAPTSSGNTTGYPGPLPPQRRYRS